MTDAKRPAVFLDRDGTLIEDREYLSRPGEVRLLSGVADGLRGLAEAGFACVVVTNQSGIGRGYFSEADYTRVAEELLRQLAAAGASLDAVYHCPAAPAEPGTAEHPDRKPEPGMLLRAARELLLDLSRSWVIGDTARDLLAAERAGCRGGVLIRTGQPIDAAVAARAGWPVADSFLDAVDLILTLQNQR